MLFVGILYMLFQMLDVSWKCQQDKIKTASLIHRRQEEQIVTNYLQMSVDSSQAYLFFETCHICHININTT